MRFNGDGKFTIMQIADTQEIPEVSPDTLRLIEAALDRARPDLVVFTGDQIKGDSFKFKGRDSAERVKKCIESLISPLKKRSVPFALTFGNHDEQAMPKEEQLEIYRGAGDCVNPASGAPNPGTFNITVSGKGSENPVFNLYIIDSGGGASGGWAEAVGEDITGWYRETREALFERTGSYVPSLVFQHIPVPEYYDALKRVDKKHKGAVRAYRTHKNEYYVLNENTKGPGDFFGESPAIPDNNCGQFDALREKGEVLGIWVGHDHINSYKTKLRGIDLGYTQGCGFNIYGPGIKRGVRVFELDENDPRNYKTHTLTFEELCGNKVEKPLKNFMYSHIPTTADQAISMGVRALLVAGAAVAGAVILAKIL